MKKKILYSVSMLLCLFYSNAIYSQTQYLSAGEKTGMVIDSLLKINPVEGVEIRHQETNGTYSTSSSVDFRISGQFLILTGSDKRNLNKEIYYNLEKVLNFMISDKKLIISLEH